MKKLIFEGSGVALVTPFTNDGVNYEVLEELIEFQIDNGTDAIIVCGTTGEPATMSDEEKHDVIRFTVEKVNGRVPVIAGTGSNSTRHSVELSMYAESVGADGLLIVTPYYNKTTQRGLVAHYKTIAMTTKLPIILYNVPGRTGLNMMPRTIAELSEIENIVGLKEASGNFSQIAEIMTLCGEDLWLYSGNDDQVVPMLALGGVGVISVAANVIPHDMHRMVKYYLAGEGRKSREIQLQAIELIQALFSEVNPIPVKEAVRQIGFDVGKCRMPLVDMTEEGQMRISVALKNYFDRME
ncbi:MAG: 4-hydroxy-tetrahydrodipicolinate synthase [Clostridia bacterium]|nr:4-hydroxy-tetrahydrodipicolinate synthase [Clostridia bacterium]